MDYFDADILSAQDYYPFGQPMPGRFGKLVGSGSTYTFTIGQTGTYRYGYNGMEMDNEIKGFGNSEDFGARMYDPRIGKFLSLDPLAKKYSGVSPFSYCLNSPIKLIDPDGKEPYDVIVSGPQAKKLVATLNKASDLIIKRDEKTGLLSASGKPKTKADKKLFEAINDKNINVEIITTNANLIDTKDGGSNVLLNPAAFEGSTDNLMGCVTATQIINVDNTIKLAGLLDEKPGNTLKHEINEAYIGAQQSPGGNYNSSYMHAHREASGLDENKADPPLDAGKNKNGEIIIQLRGTNKNINYGLPKK